MGYSKSQAKAFIKKIAPLIQSEAKERGFKVCSTIIAQAIIEGAAGTSLLASRYHNHFGMKCGSSWKGASVNLRTKEEYKVGTLTTIKDNFRAYINDAEGVKGYFDFINTKRYANLKQATTPTEYAQFLKKDGYATSSSYVNTLVSTVNKYNLGSYDNVLCPNSQVTFESGLSETPTLKIGSRGQYVRLIQTYLSVLGYQVGQIDSIYGNQTAISVKNYQKDRGLQVDGIWGKQCWKSVNVK